MPRLARSFPIGPRLALVPAPDDFADDLKVLVVPHVDPVDLTLAADLDATLAYWNAVVGQAVALGEPQRPMYAAKGLIGVLIVRDAPDLSVDAVAFKNPRQIQPLGPPPGARIGLIRWLGRGTGGRGFGHQVSRTLRNPVSPKNLGPTVSCDGVDCHPIKRAGSRRCASQVGSFGVTPLNVRDCLRMISIATTPHLIMSFSPLGLSS